VGPLLLLSFVSGGLSLGDQVMWFRIFADRFGSTNLTFGLVLVCFIGGLGLGAAASRRIVRGLDALTKVRSPIAAVGLLEALAGFSLSLTFLLTPAVLAMGGDFPYHADARGIYEPVLTLQVATLLAAVACVLLPATLMGATFPVLCDAFSEREGFPSELYAWNTLGACAGVLLAEFVLLHRLGEFVSLGVLAVAHVALGLAFLALAGRHAPRFGVRLAPPVVTGAASPSRSPSHRVPLQASFSTGALFTLAVLSGFLAGGLEGDMFRRVRFSGAISEAAMSFTSFWAIAGIFLASTTVRVLGRPRPWLMRSAFLLAALVHFATWRLLPTVRGWFNAGYFAGVRERALALHMTPSATLVPFAGSLLLILGFTGAIVLPTYFLVSLVLPAVCNSAQPVPGKIATLYGMNTLAFCAGILAFTWLAPSVNLFYAVKLLFVSLFAAAGLTLALRPGRAVPRLAAGAALAACLAGVLWVPRGFDRGFFAPDELPARFPVRGMRSNAAHTTFVVDHPSGALLFFDSHPMSGTGPGAQRYMRLMAHVPLLAQPDPTRALLICFGVGNTASAIACHPTIRALDIVDLNDKVFETAPEFAPTNRMVYRDPRVRLIHDDGRRFLERTKGTYDLVTSEPPPPREEGVYRLYSTEYYRAVMGHLTPHGMMTQWLPVHELPRRGVEMVVASFLEVFPHVLLFVGNEDQLILMGGREPFDASLLERRFGESPEVAADLARLDIREPLQILARILVTDETLRHRVPRALISDQRNDLAWLVMDPFDPARIRVDAAGVLAAVRPERLACGEQLRSSFQSLGAMCQVVPDFPLH
jgi:spermidine synthase